MIYVASPILSNDDPPVLDIHSSTPIHIIAPLTISLDELAKIYEAQGKELADALCNALPGGTLDQLLVELLRRKASHFVIASWNRTEEEAEIPFDEVGYESTDAWKR